MLPRLLLLCVCTAAHAAPARQPLIDATPTGRTLRPAPGTYAGPAVIGNPLTFAGGGKVTLDGSGRGTVLTLAASGATLRGLRLTRSGDSHDSVDAGLLVEGDGNLVEGNAFEVVRDLTFANSPALGLLDLLDRLAPFASPSLILRDAAPRMAR
jgi:nitrous oxidase accessory protein